MRTLWLTMMLVGCLKPGPKQVAAQPQALRLVTALGAYEDQTVQDLPQGVIDRVGEELSSRQLTPEPVGVFAEAFGVRRSVASRIQVLEEANIAQPLLLVSCDPRFDTQVNGRFRWEVDCDVALVSPDAQGGVITGRTEATAHLVYYHQREADAVTEVATLVSREVGRVLDQWLATRGGVAITPAGSVPITPPQRPPAPPPPAPEHTMPLAPPPAPAPPAPAEAHNEETKPTMSSPPEHDEN